MEPIDLGRLQRATDLMRLIQEERLKHLQAAMQVPKSWQEAPATFATAFTYAARRDSSEPLIAPAVAAYLAQWFAQ